MATPSTTLRKKKTQRKTAPAVSDQEQTARKPAYLKRKMAVSQPQDKEEQEADQVAREVAGAPKQEQGTKEDKEMISSKPVPSAQRLLRQVNRLVARQAEPEEEEVQTHLRRAKKPEDEDLAGNAQRSIETEGKQDESLQRLRSKADADQKPVAARLYRKAAAAADTDQESARAARLWRASNPPSQQEPEAVRPRLFRAEDKGEEQQSQGGEAESSGASVQTSVEERIANSRGQGAPLSPTVLAEMERKFGADLSAVTIHSDAESAELCKELNARAFTVGNDIYFAPGEYAPETEQGRELLAHELTHVVQQSGSMLSRKVFRNNTPAEDSVESDQAAPVTNTETEYDGPRGNASTTSRIITIRSIQFPAIAEKREKTGSENVQIRQGNEERDTAQVAEWSRQTRDGSGLSTSLDQKTVAAWHSGSESNPTYFMKIGRSGASYLVGTRTDIRDRVIRPYWKPNGQMKTYDVDHKKEYQLGGTDTSPPDNLWLLDSRTNRSAGSRINNKINTELDNLLQAWTSSNKPDRETARNEYTVTLRQIQWTGPVEGDGDSYSANAIGEEAAQMRPVVAMDRRAVQRAGLDPGEGQFVVFNNATGGRARTIELPSSTGEAIPFSDTNFITGFRPTTATFLGEDSNYIEINGTLWADNPAIQGHGFPTSFTISRMANLPQAGYLNMARAEEKIRQVFAGEIEASALSPLRLTSVGFDELGAPLVEGTVDTDISFLQGANIGFFIRGNDLGIEKTFSGPELNTPRPFEITESSLTVSLSTQRGLAAEGNVGFRIERVGEGSVTANVGTSRDFGLAGHFDFDERIFGEGTSAQVRMAYENREWSVGGTLSIPEGKVRGVRSATINVDYSEANGFSARGDAALDVPGVESGTLAVSYSEQEGFSIGGSFNLSADTPGIRGGSISATVREKPDGSGYTVSASGEAQPDIPGIDSNLSVSYDNGAFTAEFSGAYRRGMLSGTATVGVSNRAVGEDGRPSGEPMPGGQLNVFGSGSATVQIAPWLQGTAGIRFDPNGEVTVSGEIGIPNNVEIFARKEINKSLFNIAVQVPIVPGIVAEVGGGLSAVAGIGPGVLDQLRIGIEYNPAHEENTHVTGDAHLSVPADAGLRLSVRAGIGLGITGASATGGLEIGGTLGIEGAAEAGVHVDWTPATGLDLRADLSVHAQPSFTFDISGYVAVTALGFSVYDHRWQLASYQFGSDYRFGISLPVHYHEGEPFDISLDDVQFEVPEISPSEILSGLIDRIA